MASRLTLDARVLLMASLPTGRALGVRSPLDWTMVKDKDIGVSLSKTELWNIEKFQGFRAENKPELG